MLAIHGVSNLKALQDHESLMKGRVAISLKVWLEVTFNADLERLIQQILRIKDKDVSLRSWKVVPGIRDHSVSDC